MTAPPGASPFSGPDAYEATVAAFADAVQAAIATTSTQQGQARQWFSNCGYLPTSRRMSRTLRTRRTSELPRQPAGVLTPFRAGRLGVYAETANCSRLWPADRILPTWLTCFGLTVRYLEVK